MPHNTPARYADLLDFPLLHRGKVRELYAYGSVADSAAPASDSGRLLMVATDQISAFDFVLDSLIPDKGAVLTQLSQWWFAQLGDIIDNHLVAAPIPEVVRGRAVVCEQLEMIPVECVARGYLTGSGWIEYQRSQSVCGVPLPAGLHDGSRLAEPIFTPATKAALGEHDENVSFDVVAATVGPATADKIRELTLAVYNRAEGIARARGMVLADTKFEFGRRADGEIVLADEVLTPDSSRFWDAEAWSRGVLDSYDKQFVRNWLLHDSGWDRSSGEAPPALPESVIEATRARYLEAYERLTGTPFG